MKRKKSGEKRRTPSAVAALGGKPIEIARIDGDAEAWLAVFADRIAVATDKETEERHWFEFERATWSGNTLTMPFVDWNIPAFELKLADGDAPRATSIMGAVLGALDEGTRRQVASVQVTRAGQVAFTLSDGATVNWGGAEESAVKARVLKGLLSQKAKRYDVSAPHAPVTEN